MTTGIQHEDGRPAGIRRASTYLPQLESLRGVAIALVFFFHVDAMLGTGRDGHTSVSPLRAFVTAGHTGVTLFFVLSAFLLSRPFLVEAQGGSRVRRGHFFMRRVLRIMPLYASAILVAVILCRDQAGAFLGGLMSLFFLNGFTSYVKPLHPYSAVWWSLSTEAQFYLLLPVFGLVARSRRGRWLGSALLLAWAAAYAYIAAHTWSSRSITAQLNLMLSIFGRLPAFAVGIAASWLVLVHGERLRAACQRIAALRFGGGDLVVVAALFVLGLLLQIVTRIGFFRSETSWPVWHVYESALWGIVLLAVLLLPLRLEKLLVNRFWATVGVLSYSLYIVHTPIAFFALVPSIMRGDIPTDAPTRVAILLGIFALCLGVSALTYRLIERPFLVRKARIE